MTNELVPLEERGLVPYKQFGKLPVYHISQAERQGLFWLIYGPGGLGKTSLALSAMKSVFGRPLVLVEMDRGGSVGAHLDCDWIPIKKVADFDEFMSELKNGSDWLCIVIDPITELNDMYIEDAERRIGGAEPRRWYNASTSKMLKHIRTLRDLSLNQGISVILTCWEDDYTDDVTKIRKNGLKLNPALRDRVQGLVTTIGYLTLANDDKTRVLRLAPGKRYANKFKRSNNDVALQIPYDIPNPDMAPILDTLIGGQPFKLAPNQRILEMQVTKAANNEEKEGNHDED